MCLVTQDCAILSREKLTLGEPASVLVGRFSAESQAGALSRGRERQSSRSLGSCRKLKPQLVPGSYRRNWKPSGSHAIFRQKPLRSSPLCHNTSSTGEISCRLSNLPQSHVVSARHSCSQRTSQDKAGTCHFRLKETQQKLYLHRVRHWSDRDRLLPRLQAPGPQGSIWE